MEPWNAALCLSSITYQSGESRPEGRDRPVQVICTQSHTLLKAEICTKCWWWKICSGSYKHNINKNNINRLVAITLLVLFMFPSSLWGQWKVKEGVVEGREAGAWLFPEIGLVATLHLDWRDWGFSLAQLKTTQQVNRYITMGMEGKWLLKGYKG